MKKEVKNVSLCIQPLPLAVVSCRGRDGRSNALVVGFAANASIAPERFSHHLIKESGCFVINFPPLGGFRKEYDYLGSRSGRDVDKFKALDLRFGEAQTIDAPVLTDCPVNIECVVVESLRPGSHELFIARVERLRCDEEYLNGQGGISWDRIGVK